jgi:hypothetical protein
VRLDSLAQDPQLIVPRRCRLSSPSRLFSIEIDRFLEVHVYLLMDELFQS